MSAVDLSLACRMIRACDVAYHIGSPGGVQSSPEYLRVGFISPPQVFVRGTDGIDACLVGQIPEGVVVAFRGTLPLVFQGPDSPQHRSDLLRALVDWLNSADGFQITVPGIPGKVHKGFADALLDLWEPITGVLPPPSPGQRLFVTGHSKGGSVAMLAASRLRTLLPGIAASDLAVFTFAAPRVGDADFASGYHAQVLQTWRFANRDDIVPHLPPDMTLLRIFGLIPGSPFLNALAAYKDTGDTQFIAWDGSIVDVDALGWWESWKLKNRRMGHLALKLLSGRVRDVLSDHVPTGGYMVNTCGGGS